MKVTIKNGRGGKKHVKKIMSPSNCIGYRATDIRLGPDDIGRLANYAAHDPEMLRKMVLQLAGRLPDKRGKALLKAIKAADLTPTSPAGRRPNSPAMARTKPLPKGGFVKVESTPMFGSRGAPFLSPRHEEALDARKLWPSKIEQRIEIKPEDVKRGDKVEVQMSGLWPDTKVEKVTKLVGMDLSAIEKRVMAHMAGAMGVSSKMLRHTKGWPEIEARMLKETQAKLREACATYLDYWVLFNLDKAMAYQLSYMGFKPVQERLDEEGCAEVMAAVKVAEGVWDE